MHIQLVLHNVCMFHHHQNNAPVSWAQCDLHVLPLELHVWIFDVRHANHPQASYTTFPLPSPHLYPQPFLSLFHTLHAPAAL